MPVLNVFEIELTLGDKTQMRVELCPQEWSLAKLQALITAGFKQATRNAINKSDRKLIEIAATSPEGGVAGEPTDLDKGVGIQLAAELAVAGKIEITAITEYGAGELAQRARALRLAKKDINDRRKVVSLDELRASM